MHLILKKDRIVNIFYIVIPYYTQCKKIGVNMEKVEKIGGVIK